MKIVNLSLLLLTTLVRGDSELCGLEPPTDGSSCGGDTDKVLEKATLAVLQDEDLNQTEYHNDVELQEKLAYSKLMYTNDVDWEIRNELDEADELIVPDPKAAIQAFKEILEKQPNSIRATYAMVRAKQFLNTTEWNKDDVDKLQDDIHQGFVDIILMDKEKVPDPLYWSACQQGLFHAAGLNDTAKKVAIAKAGIASRAEKNEKYHEILAFEHLEHRNYEELLKVVEKAEELFHWNKMFKFLHGIGLKMLGQKKEANALLRSLEAEARDTMSWGHDILDFTSDLLTRGREAEADLILKEASKIHLFMSRYQRPLDVLPDAETKPIWSREEDVGLTAHEEEFELLLNSFEVIKAEALEVAKNMSNWDENVNKFVKTGQWMEFPLYTWGFKRQFRCSLTPRTCEVLKKFPASSKCKKCTTKLNLLKSGTHVLGHVGPTNARLRVHLPLQANGKAKMRIGKKDEVIWKEKELVVFDDSYEHEYINEDEDLDRIVLSLDIPHPDSLTQQASTTFTYHARNTYMLF